MRLTFIAMVAAATLGLGCSKKAAPAPEAADASGTMTGKSATAPMQDNPMIAASLDDLNRKVQQQQYDAAVGNLVALSQMPKSDAQEAQYRARLRETETALLTRAQKGDIAAKQSAEMLGHMMTGR